MDRVNVQIRAIRGLNTLSSDLGRQFQWHLYSLHLMSIFGTDSLLFDNDRFVRLGICHMKKK